jgi:hypothetical protein
MLNGKKSYIAGALLVLFALIGWVLGEMDSVQAAPYLFEGLGIIGLRHGIAKSDK